MKTGQSTLRASGRLFPPVVSGVCPWCVRAEVGR